MNQVLSILAGVLAVSGAAGTLVSAVAMLRAADALSRVSVLSVAAGWGLPSLVLAGYLSHVARVGFDAVDLVKTLITMLAWLAVCSVGGNALARAVYLSGSQLDPATSPNELSAEPGQDPAGGAQ